MRLMSFLIGASVTILFTPFVILFARRLGWVAKPREDRWHTRPTALMGGVAIYVATMVGWIAFVHRESLATLAVASTAIFFLGVLDDRISLRPHIKLIGQVAAAGVVILGGIKVDALPIVLSIPFTLFWIVGITNAVNLLDNMD